MSDDLDALLGGSEEKPVEAVHTGMFRRPVGVTFLAQVIGKQPYQIRSRLARCTVKEWVKHKGVDTPMYDFLEAMSYLVQPRGNIEEWFASKNAGSLPPYVNKMFWDSAHQRNRVMRASNDLWHTDEVMQVFGRVAMMIKEEVRMWVENMPGKDDLSNEQYTSIVDATNELLVSIRERLVDMPSKDQTPASMSRTIEDELESSGGMPVDGEIE